MGRGEVFTWGRVGGAFGAEVQMQLTPKLVDALLGIRIVQVAAGGDHSLALSHLGHVYAWGAHASGAVGDPILREPGQRYATVHKTIVRDLRTAELVSDGFPPAVELACGRCHSALLAVTPPHLVGDDPSNDKKNAVVDVWLFGTGVQPCDHVATQHEGRPVNSLAGIAQALAPPLGVIPLRPTRLDVRRILEMMG